MSVGIVVSALFFNGHPVCEFLKKSRTLIWHIVYVVNINKITKDSRSSFNQSYTCS